jgi:oligopeptidase A
MTIDSAPASTRDPHMLNPLLSNEFKIPFDQIRSEHVLPAVTELLADCQKRLNHILAAEEPRTYENTMAPLDAISDRLEYAVGVTRHLESVATYPELREAFNAIQGPVTEFFSNLTLNEHLWSAIKSYAATDEAKQLEGARRRYLKKTIDSFRRNGAELDVEGKAKLQEIDIELTKITTKFSENVLDSTNEFELVIEDESRLAGLPESALVGARESATQKGFDKGWRFTLQAPSYAPVMTYLNDSAIREQLYRAYNTRAVSGDRDNRPILQRILELRKAKAKLLGYKNFADLVLEDRMAHSGDEAHRFLENLRIRTIPFFEKENAQLREFAGHALQPWDVSYYAEKLRQNLYDFDEEELRPYFPVESVMNGMFQIFARVLGIRVVAQEGVPGWDPAVTYYRIEDQSTGGFLGGFYADWYPRESKRGGAWMDSLIIGSPEQSKPHLGLICGNMTPPQAGKPALLTHREVETIFHEFGHLLHHCLSRVNVRSLSGTNVAWDFVELPSQIMENWCWERESLDLFARHYETGEPIPQDLYEKMVRARNFRGANGQMRQLSFGTVDLALHRDYDPARDGDVIAYSRRMLAPFSIAPLPEDHAMIASFTHLFASPVGYGAGYYSYKWAEVLDADAFTRFRREGVFSNTVGREFREKILARGDSEDPAELYRSFMGRDPDVSALLERAGLVAV